MSSGGVPRQPCPVLVVDDDKVICRLVKAVLETDEFVVEMAGDGEAALAAAAKSSPLLVVLDFGMPGMDGVEICRQLDRSKTRVLMLSARDDPDLRSAARAAGVDVFMTKPFSAVELLDVVTSMTAA